MGLKQLKPLFLDFSGVHNCVENQNRQMTAIRNQPEDFNVFKEDPMRNRNRYNLENLKEMAHEFLDKFPHWHGSHGGICGNFKGALAEDICRCTTASGLAALFLRICLSLERKYVRCNVRTHPSPQNLERLPLAS